MGLDSSCSWQPRGGNVTDTTQSQEQMILAANSVYILLPVILLLAAPAPKIRALTPVAKCIVDILVLLSTCSCVASANFFYKPNCLNAILDQICATLFLCCSLVFGWTRSTWIARSCTLLAFGAAIFYVCKNQLEAVGLTSPPWTHIIFRWSACCSVIAAIDGGLVFVNIRQFIVACAILFVVAFSHVYIELMVMLRNGDWTFTTKYFLGSVARAFVVMLFCAALMMALPGWMCPSSDARIRSAIDINDDEESGGYDDDESEDHESDDNHEHAGRQCAELMYCKFYSGKTLTTALAEPKDSFKAIRG